MKKLFCTLTCVCVLVAILVMSAAAQVITGSCGDNVTYALNTDTGVLTISGTGEMWDYYEEWPVWSDEYDYENRPNIESVIIEEGITYIGACAFYGCYSLETVLIPESMVNFGGYAFWDVKNFVIEANNDVYTVQNGILYTKDMKTLVAYPGGRTDSTFSVPDSVTTIHNGAFDVPHIDKLMIPASVTSIRWGFWKLSQFEVDKNNAHYSSVDGVLFNKSKTELLVYPTNKTDETYTAPAGTVTIASGAFFGVNALHYLTFPESVKNFCNEAVWDCTNLKEVTFESEDELYLGYAFGWSREMTDLVVYAREVTVHESELFFYECSDDLVISCVKGSGLDTFAQGLGYTVEYINGIVRPEIKMTAGSTTAYVGSEPYNTLTPIAIKNYTLMAPCRSVIGILGCNGTTWDSNTYTLTFEKNGITIEVTANELTAKVNGENVTLPEPLYTIDESAPFFLDNYYLPVEFVAETLGEAVLWDADTQTIFINPSDETNAIVNIKKVGINCPTDGILDYSSNVTRTQLAVLAVQACTGETGFNVWNAQKSSAYFSDVTEFGTAIDYAYSLGCVRGRGDEIYGPDDNIAYKDFIVTAIRLLGYETADMSYPYGYILAAQKLGFTNGIDIVNYNQELTIGEALQLMWNVLNTAVAVTDPITEKILYPGEDPLVGGPITRETLLEENFGSITIPDFDIDGDGIITIRDVARILQYIAGWDVDIDIDAADVDGDGNVTIRDAAKILQYKAGWRTL